MRRWVFVFFFVLVAGMIWLLALSLEQRKEVAPSQPEPVVSSEVKYLVDFNQSIDKSEAELIPPIERWNKIKELKETMSIDVVCHPSSSGIVEQNLVKEIVDSFQNSNYVEEKEFPKHEPDVKLYFRKKDGFIMAGRFYVKEGVIVSPEGPIIKINAETVQKIMEKADCN